MIQGKCPTCGVDADDQRKAAMPDDLERAIRDAAENVACHVCGADNIHVQRVLEQLAAWPPFRQAIGALLLRANGGCVHCNSALDAITGRAGKENTNAVP